MDSSDMHIASYPQLQLIQRQHLQRAQQQSQRPSSLLSPVANAWRTASGLGVGAPAHGTVGTFADLAAAGGLHSGVSLAQRGGNRIDPLFNPQNTSNVYINGLPTFFSTSQLYDLCAEFGPIKSLRAKVVARTYGFVLFENIESARRCIVALRQYSDLHPSFAKTQKIPQASTEDAFAQRMERLSLFDNASRFSSSNASQSAVGPTTVSEDGWHTHSIPASAPAPAPTLCTPSMTSRPKFGGARLSLETVLEDPNVLPEVQADVFIQGLPLHLQPYELEALFAPHKIMDSRVCQVPGVGVLPDSISGVMRLSSLTVAREVMSKLDGLRFPGWSQALQVTVIENKNNEDEDDSPFKVKPERNPGPVGLGVPSIRSASQAFSGRSTQAAPSPVGTMASIHAPPQSKPSPSSAPIYSTELKSPVVSAPTPLQLDPAFSPRSPSDGTLSPVSPALTFTSNGRTPTMTTIATPRHEEDGKLAQAQTQAGRKETGLQLKLHGDNDGVSATALAVGLAGIDE
ncbi:RNA recognition motif protein [Ceratobasidium sp. AG-Ba]|nr:RNA recognition motif protein [Ceratobasidium sp. AG-Ba]QRW11032.1 RNA recognition motif protein [Ceratobasidium sp. AG-Ba]